MRVLEQLKVLRGLPRQIRSDNGSEFLSRVVDQWAYEQGLQWHTIQPGRPMKNDVQRPEPPTRAQCIHHEIHRPDLVGASRLVRRLGRCEGEDR